MSRLKKLNAFFIILIFSHSATAVIVKGFVSGSAAELNSTTLTKELVQNDSVKYSEHYGTYSLPNPELAIQTSATNNVDLAKDIPLLPSSSVYDNVVSYAGLEVTGVASRADYHGWVAVNLNSTKVDADEAVTVPEPSSLLILFGPLLFLLWRTDVLTGISRKNR